MKHLALALVLLAALPSTARADEGQWGISIWGLSYHVNRTVGYNEDNWGLGLRYYVRPDRFFLEVDALRNSNRGLALPLSAGAEFRLAPLPGGCALYGVAALAVAYYQFPEQHRTEVKAGPVPGATIGCGHFRGNVIAVLRKSSEPLAALTASLTIVF